MELLAQQAKGKLLLFFDNLESVQNPTTREIDEQQQSIWQDKFRQLLGKNPTHFAIWIEAAQQLSNKGISLLLTSRWKIPNWQESNHLTLSQCSYNDYLALARQKVELQPLLADREKLREIHKTLHGNARALSFFAAALQDIDSKEEAQFLQALQKANAESQHDMALAHIIRHRSPAEQDLLNRLQAYTTPVPIEGVIKLSLVDKKLENSRELLNNLLHVSLLEKTVSGDYQQAEYQISSQVNQWLKQQNSTPLALPLFTAAAEYHLHLYQHERKTLSQAIILHQALQFAEQHIEADQLALDNIVGHLSHLGFYQTVLQQWLPSLCESKDDKTRGEALGQTGKQLHHIGDYETALKYLKQSLDIRQEIGDKSGLCTTLFNMGHIYLENEQQQEAIEAWVTVYKIAKPMGLAQILEALESLAGSLGLEGGLDAWEKLAE